MNSDQRNTQLLLEEIADRLDNIGTNYMHGLSDRHGQLIQSLMDRTAWILRDLEAMPGNPDGN